MNTKYQEALTKLFSKNEGNQTDNNTTLAYCNCDTYFCAWTLHRHPNTNTNTNEEKRGKTRIVQNQIPTHRTIGHPTLQNHLPTSSVM